MKLTQKLTLAFLLVSLIAIGLAALFVWITTTTQFSRYIIGQRQADFIAVVTDYYQSKGDWPGVDAALRSAGLLPPFAPPGAAQPDPQPFALVDQNRFVIVAGGQYKAGEKVRQGILERGISIEVDSLVVGTVLTTGETPTPNSIEQKYIDGVNQSLLIAALGGAAIALLLGLFVARSLTRPVRDLTTATHTLASGKSAQPVPVRSADELGELAASFNQMNADLTRLNLARRQMTADIAHDLRNPLTVLGGYLESLQDGKLNPTPERLAIMQAEVRQLQHLVDDLRTLSLADAGELTLHFQPTAPGDLLKQVASAYQEQADQQKVNLVVDVESGLPHHQLDPERMEQVLGNLLSNALRYTPAGGEIRLLARRSDKVLAFEVRDTGSGISIDSLPHIFERSFRADASRSGNESGLGLAISRAIVEAHRGQISALSAGKDKGSTFLIHLPEE